MKQSKTMKRVLASVLAVAMLLGLVGPVEKAQAEGAVESGKVSLTETSQTPGTTRNKRIQLVLEAGVVPGTEALVFAEGSTAFTTRNGEDFNGMSYLYCYPDHGYYQLIMDDSYETSPTLPGDIITLEGTYTNSSSDFAITIPKTRIKCMGSESEGYYWKIIENVDVMTWSNVNTNYSPYRLQDDNGNWVSIQGKTFLLNILYNKPTDGSAPKGSYMFIYGNERGGTNNGLRFTMTRDTNSNILTVELKPPGEGTVVQTLGTIQLTDEEMEQQILLRIDFPTPNEEGYGYLNVSLNDKKVVENAYIESRAYNLEKYSQSVHCFYRTSIDANYTMSCYFPSTSVLAKVEKIEVPKAEVDAITNSDFSNAKTDENPNGLRTLVDADGKEISLQGKTYVVYLTYKQNNTEGQYDDAYFFYGAGKSGWKGIAIVLQRLETGNKLLVQIRPTTGANSAVTIAEYDMTDEEVLKVNHLLRIDFPELDENGYGYLNVSLDGKLLVENQFVNLSGIENKIHVVSGQGKSHTVSSQSVPRPVLDSLKAPEGPRANVAYIEQPNTGVVNPAVVVTRVNRSNIANLKGSAVALMDIDSSLNILDESTSISTVAQYMQDYKRSVIPAFYLDSAEEVTAICNYLSNNNIIDAFYVVRSENAALLKTARQTWKYARGIIEYDSVPADFKERVAIRRQMHQNFAFVGIFPQGALTADITAEYNIRGLSVWSYADNSGDVYGGISGGVNGLIASNPKTIIDVYESIQKTTLSGKPMAIAHRGTGGAQLYPENTITAYKGMVETYGAAACEMDLNITKDGTVILLSDKTVDRTTDGTGTVQEMTLEEVKALTVDISKTHTGLTDKIPTLEEVFETFKGTDTVLYLHLNYNIDEIKEQLPELVAKHDMEDNVVIFDRGRHYTNSTYLAYVGGGSETIEGVDEYYAIERLIKDLGPDNEQMLPSSDSGMGTKDSLVYAMSARGMLTLNSTTDGEDNLDKYFITEKGNTAILTNFANQVSDYHYEIKVQDTAFVTGELIDLSQKVKKIVGDATVSCGLVQVGGDELAQSEEGYTLTSAGSAQVVYYADITLNRSYGNLTYRLYSAPVTVKMVGSTYLGDPDLDGQHTVVDLIKTKKATLQTKPSLGLYDIYKDNIVNQQDVLRMRELILGIFSITN